MIATLIMMAGVLDLASPDLKTACSAVSAFNSETRREPVAVPLLIAMLRREDKCAGIDSEWTIGEAAQRSLVKQTMTPPSAGAPAERLAYWVEWYAANATKQQKEWLDAGARKMLAGLKGSDPVAALAAQRVAVKFNRYRPDLEAAFKQHRGELRAKIVSAGGREAIEVSNNGKTFAFVDIRASDAEATGKPLRAGLPPKPADVVSSASGGGFEGDSVDVVPAGKRLRVPLRKELEGYETYSLVERLSKRKIPVTR